MTGKICFVLLSLAVSGVVAAQDAGKYRCTYGDLVRRVEIFTEPGVSVPCEVHYFKDTEAPGEPQVLWSAQADAAYCESQTEAFVAKLEGWGWSCAAGAADAPEPGAEPEPAEEEAAQDDTDVLSPGDPSGD